MAELPELVLNGELISFTMSAPERFDEYNWMPRKMPDNRSERRLQGASPTFKAGLVGVAP